MSTVQIKVASVDQTANIVFATAEFISAVNGTVGSCKFRVRDEDRTLSFITGASIELLIDGSPVWTGFLTQQLRVYAFPAENVSDAGLTRWLDIVGVDLNTLFNKRFVFTVADPTNVFGKIYGPNQPDNTAIADLVADYLDLSGDSLDTSTKVEFVGNINVDQNAQAWLAGDTFGQAMASIASLPGAVYFIDPARFLVYTDANTADAPLPMSDVSPDVRQSFAITTIQGNGDTSFTPPVDGPPDSAYGLGPGFIWQKFDSTVWAYDRTLIFCDGTSIVIPANDADSYRLVRAGPTVGTIQFDFLVPADVDQGSEQPAYGVLYASSAVATDDDAQWATMYVWSTGAADQWQFGCYDQQLNVVGPVYTATLTPGQWYTAKMAYDATDVHNISVVYTIWLAGTSEPSPQASGVTTLSWNSSGGNVADHGLHPQAMYIDLWEGPVSTDGRIRNLAMLGGAFAGYREMTITKDGSSLANDVLAWGIGYGSNVPVFDREQDATSESLHGLWQAATVRNGIYKQNTIDRVAQSILDGSPENLRGSKDDRVAVKVVTYVPGFLPAQKVDFTSNVFGFNDVIPIRKMRVTFDAPDTPKYELDISHAIDQPWGFLDQFMLKWPQLPPLPHLPPLPVFGFACSTLDDFERTVNPGFGVTTPNGTFTYDPPVYSVSPGTSTALAHVTGGVGRFDLTVQATDPAGANHADASVALPGVITDLNEFRLSGHAIMVQNFPAFTSPTSLADAALDWAITIQDDPTLGSYTIQFQVELVKNSPTGGPVSYSFHVFAADFSTGGAGALINLTTSEQFVTALEFDWVIDRSATRGTIQFTMSHINGGLPYEGPITAGPAPVAPVTIKAEGDAALQNHVAVDWSPVVENDNWIVCGGYSAGTSGATGYTCVVPSRFSDTVFTVPQAFVPNSTLVWASGLLQRRGTDYTEGGDGVSIVFSSPVVDLTPIRVCYQAAVLS